MVLWCNLLSLWALNPTIRVQIPGETHSHTHKIFYAYIYIVVEWPSGLRRQVKALISSEARVRIPSQPTKKYIIIIICVYIIYEAMA